MLDSAAVNAVEEIDPPATTRQRQGEQALAEALASGQATVTVRHADGTE